MIDNEIIKALDFCEGYNGVSFCNDCPLFDDDNCVHILSHEAFGLINRQKAEIEKMRLDAECLVAQIKDAYIQIDVLNHKLNAAKSEAIKEFAERLKEKMRLEDDCEYDCGQCCYGCKEYVPIIDNLVKEMTEAEK